MYQIIKDGSVISYEDKARFVKLQANGVYVLCLESEAQGVVVDNDRIANLTGHELPGVSETVHVEEINGSALLTDMQTALTTLGYTEGGAE